MAMAGKAIPYHVLRTIPVTPPDPASKTPPGPPKAYRQMLAQGDALMRDVCLASEDARKSYFATLEANKAALGAK